MIFFENIQQTESLKHMLLTTLLSIEIKLSLWLSQKFCISIVLNKLLIGKFQEILIIIVRRWVPAPPFKAPTLLTHSPPPFSPSPPS